MGKDKDTGVDNRLGDTAREGEGGTSGERSTDTDTLPRVEQTAHGKLLHSTGRPAQHSVIT